MKKSSRSHSETKILIVILCICVAAATLGIGIYVAYVNGVPGMDSIMEKSIAAISESKNEHADDSSDDGSYEYIQTEEPETKTEIDVSYSNETETETSEISYSFPERMMAVTLNAGQDYLADNASTVEDIKKSIEEAVTYAKNISANSVYVNLSCDDGSVLFSGSSIGQKKISIDVLKYIIDTAESQGLDTYFIYNISDLYGKDSLSEMVAEMNSDLETVASYGPDGIMIDSYEINASGNMYKNYLSYGSGEDFDSYLCEITSKLVSEARKTLMKVNPEIPVGLSVGSVWANSATDESGSSTDSQEESLVYGHSDTKSFVENEDYNFIAVKGTYATGNKKSGFPDYVSWWNDIINDEVPMYVYHFASKACSSENGWSDPSELSDQVIAAEKVTSFEGSIFDSLSALKDNPSQSTDALIKYLTENIDPSFLLTQLEMTRPAKTTFSTYETVAVFAGASDINFDLTMNGEKVSRDANGAFMLTIDLQPGLNTFTFVHKEKTITYNITRNVQVLKEISPLGNVTANGGMSITVSALAYENSVVTATLGSSTVTLQPSTVDDDNTDNESTYRSYSGTITVPAATSDEQKLGNITVQGTWSTAATETMAGAYVTVAAKATSGSLIEITADAAETFPTDTLNDLSDYDCYPLAKGTMDYTVGDEMTYVEGSNTYNYYILESGQRVYSKDVKIVSGELGGNIISDVTVSSNKRYTYVSFDMSQPVSYVAKYSSSEFSIDFKYTESVPDDMNLECTPLFDSVKWDDTCVKLKLSTPSGFLGYYAYYSDNSLVFRFNNPTGTYSLSGVSIVVDVGHSALGVGALGYLSAYGEYEINLSVCQKLKSELESMGATVYMMDTVNSRPSLEDRTAYAFSKNPLLFISIHCNSSTSSTGNGTECFYFTRFTSSYASMFSDAVSSALETTNRGARIGRYYVTRVHEYPAVLGEIGFVSNESDYYKMIQTSYQYEIAESIAQSVSDYMGYVGRNGEYSYGLQSSSGYTENTEDEEENQIQESSDTSESSETSGSTKSQE